MAHEWKSLETFTIVKSKSKKPKFNARDSVLGLKVQIKKFQDKYFFDLRKFDHAYATKKGIMIPLSFAKNMFNGIRDAGKGKIINGFTITPYQKFDCRKTGNKVFFEKRTTLTYLDEDDDEREMVSLLILPVDEVKALSKREKEIMKKVNFYLAKANKKKKQDIEQSDDEDEKDGNESDKEKASSDGEIDSDEETDVGSSDEEDEPVKKKKKN